MEANGLLAFARHKSNVIQTAAEELFLFTIPKYLFEYQSDCDLNIQGAMR